MSRLPLDLAGLTGQQEVFRLSGAIRRDDAVEDWLNGEPAELRALARKWFSQVRRCGEDVLELMHDKCPTACVEDAAFAQINAFRSHVNVGFFHGAVLEDPAGLLEGSGKRMRHVKLVPGQRIDDKALADLIHATYNDIKTRLG